MFDPVDPKQSLPNLEEGILRYWQEEDTFKRSLKQRSRGSGDAWDGPAGKQGESFSFYDGPPFATGLPHYGHLLAGTIKDVIPRYQTMRGKYVERRFGWDCHGLPIENLIEQEHGIKNKQEIEERGVGWFNDLCRDAVQRYTKEWRTVVERMGRWVDMDWDYRTMDPEYMESMWWAFAELQKKGLIYEGHKPMHICPRCATPLSNFEVTQGYADRTDQSVFMTFPLEDDPKTVLLSWTTTPWSLASNLWLLISPDISYVRVKEEGSDTQYILAEKLVEKVFEKREHEVVGKVPLEELEGKRYKPLFPYYTDTVIPSSERDGKPVTYGEKCYFIMRDETGEVSDEDGTGIVHITSAYGEDGFSIAQKEGVDMLHHLNVDGTFKESATDFAGLNAKPEGEDPMATDKIVIQKLKELERHFSSYTYTHSYPHCWRCDTPLLNYATSSWFVSVEKIKEKMLANNAKTEWMPAYLRDGRYGNWLEGARDWAISRNRYWGTPLPIWRDESGNMDVIGSRGDLMAKKRIRFTKVTALRHAESEGNLIPIYQANEPGTNLTSTGKKQAKSTAKHFRSEEIQTIYCSPLARTKQTADILAKKLGATVIVDERLREVDFGDYEGKTVDFSDLSFIKARRAHKMESGKAESIYHFDGMETWTSVAERIGSFMEDVLPKHRSEHILVVTHADPVQNIRSFFSKEDPIKLSHQPYPTYTDPYTFFWDHDRQEQMDLHKDRVDDIVWAGSGSDASISLTMVRHGETDCNAEHRAQGQADNPLNEKGKEQARVVAKKLQGKQFDVIISSDLERSAETAKIIGEVIGVSEFVQLPELKERSNGDWDGVPVEEVMAQTPGIEDYRGTNFHNLTAPNGESLSEFLSRIESACNQILEEHAGKRVMIVSHGGTTRAILTLIENRTYRDVAFQKIKNAEEFIEVSLNPLMKRIPEVVDCWFESGSMPYAQRHYPFEVGDDKRKVPTAFPANFIAEGLDQTRAWFYTLMVLSTALFEETPFQHVVVNGIVLADDGKKMSKRLKNYPDPMEVVSRHGADAVRFALMSSPAVRAEDLRFSEKLVEETVRSVLLPLWNTYSFFVTYANAAKFEATPSRHHSSHPLDMWIRAEVQDLVNRMTKELDNYDLSATCNELHETIDALTNWYVRLSRRRFAGKGGDRGEEDRHDALETLHDVLLTISQLLAPFCPYITDAIYLNLIPDDHHSIHMTDWPDPRELRPEEEQLLTKNRLMRLVVSLGLSVRAEQKVKNRQPLAKATVALPPALQGSVDFTDEDLALLRQELNVKELAFSDNPESLAERYVQVDARAVGPRLGPRVQEIIKAGKEGEFEVQDDGSILILDEELAPGEASVAFRGREGENVAADRGVVVSMDTTVTDALQLEGDARDLIRAVQRLRKESGLSFTDRITLNVQGADEILQDFAELIAQETRATLGEVDGKEPFDKAQGKETVEIGGREMRIAFSKL